MPQLTLHDLFERLSSGEKFTDDELHESKERLRELETKIFGEGLSVEAIQSVKVAVRELMPLPPDVDEDDVAVRCLKHLHYFNYAVQEGILGWSDPRTLRKSATNVKRLGRLAQQLAHALDSLSPAARPYIRGRLSMSEPGEKAFSHALADRLKTFKSITGIEFPGVPGAEINLNCLSKDLHVLAERTDLAASMLRPREKGRGGRRRLFHEHAFAKGIWEVWANACGSAPVPNNRDGAQWPFLKLLGRLGKLVDPEFNGTGAAESAYEAHRERKAAE